MVFYFTTYLVWLIAIVIDMSCCPKNKMVLMRRDWGFWGSDYIWYAKTIFRING